MVMENHLVVLLLSVVIVIGAFYGYTVEQKIFELKNDLLKHEKEIKEVKVELKSTKQELKQLNVELKSMYKELTEVKVDLDSTRTEVKQINVELESTKKEVKQVEVELESTKNEVKQVELELGSTRKELKQVNVELESTKNEVKQVKVELGTTKKEVKEVKVELDKIKTELHTQRPGFYVTLSSHPTLGQSQRIEFDKIITDVGNNYDKISAVFTVPKDGLYHFSFTMFSYTGTLHAEIMQNDQVIGRNYGHSSGISATINVVISCKQGDSVYVRHMAGRGTENIHGTGYTALSGFLIN